MATLNSAPIKPFGIPKPHSTRWMDDIDLLLRLGDRRLIRKRILLGSLALLLIMISPILILSGLEIAFVPAMMNIAALAFSLPIFFAMSFVLLGIVGFITLPVALGLGFTA